MILSNYTGNPSRLGLVLLPGMDGTGSLFGPLISFLGSDIDPMAIGYPGDRFLGYRALEEMVLDLLPRGQPFALVGESFSGPLAVRIARRAPSGLIGVVLVASFLRSPVPWWPAALRFLVRSPLFWFPPPRFLLRWLLMDKHVPDSLIAEVVAAIRSVRPAVLAARARAALAVDEREAFAALSVPVLHVAAGGDRLVQRVLGVRPALAPPKMRSVTLDAPHFVLQCRPKLAADAIEEFLRSDCGWGGTNEIG